MKEAHPLTEYIPELADQGELEASITQDGFNNPVVIYEGKIIEGRVRYRAALARETEPSFRQWISADTEVIDWMVKEHVRTHELDELQKVALVANLLPVYKGLKGATHQRLYEAIGLPWNKIRVVDWLQEAGALGPVLNGEQDIYEAARTLGLASDKRSKALGKNYGAGDKFDEVFVPVKKYLAAWKRKGYEFRHVNPKEAARRLSLIESLVEELQAAKTDLEKRAITATLSAPPERTRK